MPNLVMRVRDQILCLGCHPRTAAEEGGLGSYSGGIALASEGVSRERSQYPYFLRHAV